MAIRLSRIGSFALFVIWLSTAVAQPGPGQSSPPPALPAGWTQEQFDRLVDAISATVAAKLKEGGKGMPHNATTAHPAAAADEDFGTAIAAFKARAGSVLRAYPDYLHEVARIPTILEQAGTGRGVGAFLALLVVALLIVLSDFGVNIIPLLAGVSVFGLAISFGSQTLVRDVVSGIFYLAGDAFRVGEYIDCGKAKGIVEGFTLRSLKLRHQNGQVHMIPFGQLGQITNFSRDWTTVKFNLRFARKTDLERLRKVVKAIGQDMLDDPEFKDSFLEPLKMRGGRHHRQCAHRPVQVHGQADESEPGAVPGDQADGRRLRRERHRVCRCDGRRSDSRRRPRRGAGWCGCGRDPPARGRHGLTPRHSIDADAMAVLGPCSAGGLPQVAEKQPQECLVPG